MMAEKLMPCPFCGGEADVHYFAHDDSECTVMCSNPNCRASVSARSCGSMTTAYNRARKLWNRRAERTCSAVEFIEEETFGTGVYFECSECHETLGTSSKYGNYSPNYCPSCGARIVKEEA